MHAFADIAEAVTQISPIWRFVAVLLLVSFVAWVFVLF